MGFSYGFVTFFYKDDEQQKWVQAETRLRSQMPLPNEQDREFNAFGWALSASADGNLLAVSARGTKAHNGAVEIFKCAPGFRNCAFWHGLQPADDTTYTGPRGIQIRNNFGMSIALSGNGRTLAVGSTGYEYEQGTVFVYE